MDAWHVIQALAGVLLTVLGGITSWLVSDHLRLKEQNTELRIKVAALQATVEAEASETKRRFSSLEKWMETISEKLDRVVRDFREEVSE